MSVKFKFSVDAEVFCEKMQRLNCSLQTSVQEALTVTAQETAARARQLAPVRSGRLAQSILAQTSAPWQVSISCNVPYAVFQEFGTRSITPHFFLTRAIQENIPRLLERINQAIHQAAEETSKQ